MSQPLEVLRDAKRRIESPGKGHFDGFFLGKALEQTDEFRAYRDKLFRLPAEHHKDALDMIGMGLFTMLQSGVEPEEALNQARSDLQRNSYEVVVAHPVEGFTFTGHVRLLENVDLVSHTSLAPISDYFNKEFANAPQSYLPVPILMHRSTRAPAIVDEAIDEPKTPDYILEAEEDAKFWRVAFSLAERRPIEIAGNVTLVAGGLFANIILNVRGRTGLRQVHDPSYKVNLPLTKRHYEDLKSFKERDALLLGAIRFVDSRSRSKVLNRAIDLGMASELLLMFDNGKHDKRGEFRNKIGLRAGWLLGADVDERLEVSKNLMALYDARSSAVHMGKLPKGFATKGPGYDNEVQNVILRLLHMGAYPDWSRLLFGEGALTREG